MTGEQALPHSPWRSAGVGLLAGAIAALLGVLAVVAVTLLLEGPLLLLLALAFGDMRLILWPIGLCLAALAAGAVAVMGFRRWVLPMLKTQVRGVIGWSSAGFGVLLALALAVWMSPQAIKSAAVELATGSSIEERASLPTSDAERMRVQRRVRPAALAGDPAAQVELGLELFRGAAGERMDRAEGARLIARAASHPEGFEARLVRAVDVSAEPARRHGRVQTGADVASKVASLQDLRPLLPAEWQPVLLHTIGRIQMVRFGGDHPDDQPFRDATYEAGLAGSLAFSVLAATLDESVARHYQDGQSPTPAPAEAAWRRALEGYVRAGAVFEVERLRIEDLPEDMRTLIPAPAAASAPKPDAILAQRLWRFAWALDREEVRDRTTSGQRNLASSVALLALERAPDVAQIASSSPARDWFDDPWALGRWLLALRHVRGDCLAALALSDSIRQRRRPAVVNRPQPPASPLDLAWATAWAEAGERCASNDADSALARERRASLDYLTFKPGELEAAREGVAATIAAFR